MRQAFEFQFLVGLPLGRYIFFNLLSFKVRFLQMCQKTRLMEEGSPPGIR